MKDDKRPSRHMSRKKLRVLAERFVHENFPENITVQQAKTIGEFVEWAWKHKYDK